MIRNEHLKLAERPNTIALRRSSHERSDHGPPAPAGTYKPDWGSYSPLRTPAAGMFDDAGAAEGIGPTGAVDGFGPTGAGAV
jgi:hypothetical protein